MIPHQIHAKKKMLVRRRFAFLQGAWNFDGFLDLAIQWCLHVISAFVVSRDASGIIIFKKNEKWWVFWWFARSRDRIFWKNQKSTTRDNKKNWCRDQSRRVEPNRRWISESSRRCPPEKLWLELRIISNWWSRNAAQGPKCLQWSRGQIGKNRLISPRGQIGKNRLISPPGESAGFSRSDRENGRFSRSDRENQADSPGGETRRFFPICRRETSCQVPWPRSGITDFDIPPELVSISQFLTQFATKFITNFDHRNYVVELNFDTIPDQKIPK